MPRALRVEYPGAMDHILDRGDRQERIILDEVDRRDWLKTLAEACRKTGWQVHAYCLMSNHFHKAIDKVRRAGLRPAFDSPIGMGFRFWWRAERWHTQSGPEARAPVESVDDFVNGPGQSDGGPPMVLPKCYGSATVVLPCGSRSTWEQYRSNTVALPWNCRGGKGG